MEKHFLPFLSKAINAYLGLDPESKHRLEELAGKAITIELLPFHFIFQCVFTQQGIHLHPGETHPADALLRGTPLQLTGAMLLKQHRQRFFADDLVMEGNAEIGLQIIELFDALKIDWEEYASHLIGDVPAYHVSRFMRGLGKWLRTAEHSFSSNINEYMHEEAEWLPAREALNDFFNDVDTLRMDVDRAEATLQQLITNHEAHS